MLNETNKMLIRCCTLLEFVSLIFIIYFLYITEQRCDNDKDDESDEQTGSVNLLNTSKKWGRRGNWSMASLNDFIDIIVSDEYNKKKLIFTNTKNQRNASIYQNILTELKKRCTKRGEDFEATIPQLRNKFKKCVSECKKAALTIKTATGIKRFQDSKGFGSWFNQLFALVKTRDSCQPDQAVEPSALPSEGKSTSEDTPNKKPATTNQFTPIPNKKAKKEDILKTTHDLLKKTIENDKSDSIMKLMKEEFELSRQHELKPFQMLLQSQQPSTHAQQPPFGTPHPPAQQPSPSFNPVNGWNHQQVPVGYATSLESWAQNQSIPQQHQWEGHYPGNY